MAASTSPNMTADLVIGYGSTIEGAVCTGTCRIEGTFCGELKAGRILLLGAGELNRVPRPQAVPKHPSTPQEPCTEQGT